jgi:hypothetical protein
MTLLQKMDRLVYATRIDRIIFMKHQTRAFRWTPLLVFAALVTGYVLMARTSSLPGRSFLIGWMLFYGAFLVSFFLRLFGPRFVGTETYPLDERELMVKSRAYAMSGVVLASFAMLACFYMPSAGVLGLWQPHAPLDWINLGFGFQAAGNLLPTWIASWLEPRAAAGQED